MIFKGLSALLCSNSDVSSAQGVDSHSRTVHSICISILDIIDFLLHEVTSDKQPRSPSISAWTTFVHQVVGCIVASCSGAVYFPSQITANSP